jgi:hypothetical protein
MKIQLQLGESIGLGERQTVVQINSTHARIANKAGDTQLIPITIDDEFLLSHPRMRDYECVNNLGNFLGTFSVARVAELTIPLSNEEMKETIMPSQVLKRTPRTKAAQKAAVNPKLSQWHQKRSAFVQSLIASKTSDDEIWEKTKKKFHSSDRKSVDALVKSLK